MTEIFGVPTQALFGQLLIGLINGSFYALLSLGLAVIFGLLNIINFTHGAQYMMGAFVAWFLLNKAGAGYWWRVRGAPAGGPRLCGRLQDPHATSAHHSAAPFWAELHLAAVAVIHAVGSYDSLSSRIPL